VPWRCVRCDIVGVGAIRALARELQHLGTQGRQHAIHRRRSNTVIRSLVHRIQIGAHLGDRLLIGVTAQALHQRNVTHAQPKNEAIGIGLAQSSLRIHCGDRIAAVDVGDPRRHHHAGRGGQQQPCLRQGFAPNSLAVPHRAVAQLLQFGNSFFQLARRLFLEGARPDSNLLQLQGGFHVIAFRRFDETLPCWD